MEINKSINPITIKERGLPLFFCKNHPKFELNLVCREKRCSCMGLICAKCLEEYHTNQFHNQKSFLGVDDIINVCQKIAQPVILSEHTHPAHFKEVNEDNQFYKLDKLCKSTIERLRDFKYKIGTLIRKLELNLKENILQIRKRAVNNLGDVGELLNFIHQKVGYSEFMNKSQLIKNKSKDVLQDITQNQINLIAQNSSFQIKGNGDNQKYKMFIQELEEESRQKQFTNIINRITSNLSSDTKILQIKEINDYVFNYEQGLIEYERDIKNEIDRIIDQTTSFIKRFYFNNQREDEQKQQQQQSSSPSSQSSLSLKENQFQIKQLKYNQIYTNIRLDEQNLFLQKVYNGNIPCWIQLVDIIKDIPSSQNLIAIIKRGDVILKYLQTNSQTLLENDDFLNQFTTSNIYDNDENQELFIEQQPQFFLYII